MVTRKSPNPYTFYDVPAIVKFFGGRVELVRKLEYHNILHISTAAIDKWQHRGSIPASRLTDLQALARALRKKFDPKAFAPRTAPKKKAA